MDNAVGSIQLLEKNRGLQTGPHIQLAQGKSFIRLIKDRTDNEGDL